MKIITIARDYGAGGHSVAKMVAEKLSLEYYDKDIIKNTATTSGFEEALIASEEETYSGTDSFIHSITPVYRDSKDAIFDYERAVILDLARKGPCIFIGRCADYILREAGYDTLDVFLHADDINRALRVSELINSKDPAEIKRTIHKMDKFRANYCMHYTGKRWGDARNYDLSLDTGRLGYETCAEIICAAAQK